MMSGGPPEWRDGKVTDSDTGQTFAPHALPLELVTPIEAFYFAVQAAATLMSAIQWMLPVALLLLLGSLVWISQKTRPEML